MEDLTVEFITEVFEYLEELRISGVTNMFGARPYIMEAFEDVDAKAAGWLLSQWMKTYGDGSQPAEQRAAVAFAAIE